MFVAVAIFVHGRLSIGTVHNSFKGHDIFDELEGGCFFTNRDQSQGIPGIAMGPDAAIGIAIGIARFVACQLEIINQQMKIHGKDIVDADFFIQQFICCCFQQCGLFFLIQYIKMRCQQRSNIIMRVFTTVFKIVDEII